MIRSIKYGSMLLALLMMVMVPLQSHAADDDAKGLFVFVTSGDVQTQMMAMVLSTKTLEQGKSVQVMLCGPGGELAMKECRQTVVKPLGKSPQMLLKNLISKGVTVELCPLYLPNIEASSKELIDGVSIAKPPVIAEKIREDDVKLFTF
ncbi:MAG: DsrE family protein [Chlorobium sp.]|nr:DsrE family protein [Chlorobium sp.]MCW8818745.1 DsrE family protein [Ignavibacteriaceae bacterium]